jgi:hypothetical protein
VRLTGVSKRALSEDRDLTAAVIVEVFDAPFARGYPVLKDLDFGFRFHSSSASRVTAGAAGFLTFTQQSARPERYGEPRRFDTMPSQPSAQAWR